MLVGAGDAIGAAVARRFASGGYTVCICRRDAAKSQALVDELRKKGQSIHALSVDARQEADVQKLFADVEREIGPIDICLFNAGSNVNTPLLDTTETLFFKAWELACYAGFLFGRKVPRVMLPRGRGTIFLTGATASVRGGWRSSSTPRPRRSMVPGRKFLHQDIGLRDQFGRHLAPGRALDVDRERTLAAV